MTRLTRGDEVAIASINARERTFRSDMGWAARVAAVRQAEVWSNITSRTGRRLVIGGTADPDSGVCLS
jgi:hypothetical protein